MTPKEKAEELFIKYRYAIRTKETEIGFFTNVIQAKECSLIAIDEIMKVVSFYNDTQAEYYYWEEVQEEIEKL